MAIAGMVAASSQAKIAGAVAARMLKANNEVAQQMVGMLQESAENLQNLAAGVGGNVDFSA